MKNAFVLVLALVACKSDKDKDSSKSETGKKPVAAEPAKPAPPPKTPPLPVAAFVELDTAQLAYKPQNILGKTPADVAKALPQYLRQDKTSAAVKAKTDELMADMNNDMKRMGIDTRKRTDIEFRLPPTPGASRDTTHTILHVDDDGTIRQYGVWIESTAAEKQEVIATFDKLWGPHKIINETLGPQMTWFDAKTGIRASTRQKADKPDRIDIDYVRYLPLAKFFGEPGPLWGFEKAERPFLGATVEELQAAYGKLEVDDKAGLVKLELPPTDYDGNTAHTMILMFLERGKVREWRTHIPFEDYEPARAEYEAALDAKFGKPKPARYDHLIYSKKPKVDVQYSKYTHELDVVVSR